MKNLRARDLTRGVYYMPECKKELIEEHLVLVLSNVRVASISNKICFEDDEGYQETVIEGSIETKDGFTRIGDYD